MKPVLTDHIRTDVYDNDFVVFFTSARWRLYWLDKYVNTYYPLKFMLDWKQYDIMFEWSCVHKREKFSPNPGLSYGYNTVLPWMQLRTSRGIRRPDVIYDQIHDETYVDMCHAVWNDPRVYVPFGGRYHHPPRDKSKKVTTVNRKWSNWSFDRIFWSTGEKNREDPTVGVLFLPNWDGVSVPLLTDDEIQGIVIKEIETDPNGKTKILKEIRHQIGRYRSTVALGSYKKRHEAKAAWLRSRTGQSEVSKEL